MSIRIRAAWAALRGRTVVTNATIEGILRVDTPSGAHISGVRILNNHWHDGQDAGITVAPGSTARIVGNRIVDAGGYVVGKS